MRKALRCTNQLHIDADPKIMALKAKLAQQTQLTTQVFRAFNNTLTKGNDGHSSNGSNKQKGTKPTTGRGAKPAWFDSAPTDISQTHDFEGRVWNWCPKCGTANEHINALPRKSRPDPAAGQNTQENKWAPTPIPTTPGITIATLSQLLQQYTAAGTADMQPTTNDNNTNTPDDEIDPDNY
jgi:hypothetical protein